MSNELRESSFALLSALCDPALPADSLRIVGHSLLNLVGDTGTDSISDLMSSLPWFAAHLNWEKGKPIRDLAETLVDHTGVLGVSFIVERIREYETDRRFAHKKSGPRATFLQQLATLDRRLVELSIQSAASIRSVVVHDVTLLRAVVELAGSPEHEISELAKRLITSLGLISPSPTLSHSLAILEDLETSWSGGRIANFEGLGERSRRFEMSSLDHLRKHGVLFAVRAAVVASASSNTEEWIHSVPELRANPETEALALALASVRGNSLKVLMGAYTLTSMEPWLTYLTGPCADLAEVKEITLREAMSFAHFSLHLLNFCDLLGEQPNAAKDEVRKSLMDIEDELKEVSIAAQRRDRSELAVNLSRYTELKWRRVSSRERVADRLSRLAGNWTEGLKFAPIGSAAQLGPAEVEDELVNLHALEAEVPGASEALANLLSRAQFEGHLMLEGLDVRARMALVISALIMARDSDDVDVARPFTIDFDELGVWTDAAHFQMFQHVLLQMSLKTIMDGEEPRSLMSSNRGDNGMRVGFSPPERVHATLLLLADQSIGGPLRVALQRSLQGLEDGPSNPLRANQLGS